MNTEQKLTPEEIGRRITAGMGLVYDLFKEMNSLFRLITQGVVSSEIEIRPMGPKAFMLPRAKKGASIADRFVRTDMGWVAAIGESASDEPEEDEEPEDDTDGGDDEVDNASVLISPDSQFLGVRAVLFDPASPQESVPVLVAAILSSLSLRRTGKKAKKIEKNGDLSSFQVKRTALKRLVKQLNRGVQRNKSVTAHIVGGELTAKVAGVEIAALGDFDSEQKVSAFVEKVVGLVEES
jgi:hypothetical protein